MLQRNCERVCVCARASACSARRPTLPHTKSSARESENVFLSFVVDQRSWRARGDTALRSSTTRRWQSLARSLTKRVTPKASACSSLCRRPVRRKWLDFGHVERSLSFASTAFFCAPFVVLKFVKRVLLCTRVVVFFVALLVCFYQ